MKKENRKMAQERRATERLQQEKKMKTKKSLQWIIPLAVVLVLAIVLIVGSRPASETETDSTETAVTLQTDSSLEIKDGDTVSIEYVGTIDGVEFEGGSTGDAGAILVVGSGSYIDDFEEQLIGAHPGDEVEVKVTFPEDYGKEELNGKDAVFMVKVHGIYDI